MEYFVERKGDAPQFEEKTARTVLRLGVHRSLLFA